MTQQTPKISVIIGTYNQCSILQKVLPYYEHQSAKPESFEVVVVDSTSNDGSVEFLKSYKPNFQFSYKIQENNGKAGARNTAAKLAKGTILLITDADMIPGENFIQGHIDAHQNATKPACFEGLAWNLKTLDFPPDPATLTPQVGRHPGHMVRLGWYYFLTGNISIPKELFWANNGFDETFKGYGWEDLELGYRLSKQKVPLYYLKTAVNYHYHVISVEDEIERNEEKGKSALMLLRLHPELKWFLGLNPISCYVFPRISKNSKLYAFFENTCYQSKNKLLKNIGTWFLKEYRYLTGALKK